MLHSQRRRRISPSASGGPAPAYLLEQGDNETKDDGAEQMRTTTPTTKNGSSRRLAKSRGRFSLHRWVRANYFGLFLAMVASLASLIFTLKLQVQAVQQHSGVRRGFVEIEERMLLQHFAESPFYSSHLILPKGIVRSSHRSFGGLDLEFSSWFERSIESDDAWLYQKEREALLDDIDEAEIDERWLHDDDYDYPLECYRNNWATKYRPTCNKFHEETLDRTGKLQDFYVTYLKHGSYRDVWLMEPKTPTKDEYGFIWKAMIHDDSALQYDMKRFGEAQIDATVMERLTSSPRIVDMYGHCGTSVFTELLENGVKKQMFGPGGDGYLPSKQMKKLRTTNDVPNLSLNRMTLTEKLDMAIVMAEALADIHGFEGGVIMHGDLHSPQWLRSMKGEVKLIDFNKGKILRFNRDTNSYCGLRINCYKSDYRAPENNACVDDGNEASDTFSFGNNIYLILTGLWPYFDYPDGRKQKKRLYEMIANGEILPTVHPRFRTRSRIEAGLVKIMEQCWEHDFHKRISIFSVLQQLYELREKTEQRTG